MNRLSGKKALVTGAARGIGHAIAIAFAKEGADVAILDLRKENAATTAEEARKLGVNSLAVAADVSNEQQVKRAVAEVQQAFGRIDILVNNAGIDTTSVVAEMPTSMWDEMMAVKPGL